MQCGNCLRVKFQTLKIDTVNYLKSSKTEKYKKKKKVLRTNNGSNECIK